MEANQLSTYPITTKTVPTFYFIGVTTSKSSIMKVFPVMDEGTWAGRGGDGRGGLQNSR